MWKISFLAYLVSTVSAITAGTQKENVLLSFPIKEGINTFATKLTLDANWRWVHNSGGYDNCFDTTGWVQKYCPDNVTCFKNCQLEGVTNSDWVNPYGVSVNSNSVTLKYITRGTYGDNIGSRLYVVNTDSATYYGFKVVNREFTFTVDVSQVGCGLNAAVYFVQIPLTGTSGQAGPAYGTGYGDAQVPTDIKYINGYPNTANLGSGAPEFDISEMNNMATAFTAHNCRATGSFACSSDADCGRGNYRYTGPCDKDGADYNAYRLGNKTLYGYGSSFTVDTSKPFQIITQFITSDGTDAGDLVEVRRYFVQGNSGRIFGGSLTDNLIAARKTAFNETNQHQALGGLKAIGTFLNKGVVLALSLWDDTSPAAMNWLDSTYPVGSASAGSARGPCSADSGNPNMLRATVPNSKVIYSDVQVNPITTSSSPSAPPVLNLPRYCPAVADLVVAYGLNVSLANQGWTIKEGGAVATKQAFNLLGGYISYTLDLSQTNAGVNTNMYSISPANIPLSGFTQTQYCDGAKTGSQWCVENDFVESNGACGGASTLHTVEGTGSTACTAWGCSSTFLYAGKTSIDMRVDFATDGSSITTVNGVAYPSAQFSPAPKTSDYATLVSAYVNKGAVIYSSSWSGWVPLASTCGNSGVLTNSVFTLKNLVISGTVVQGQVPTLCGSIQPPTPSPPTPSPPTPSPPSTGCAGAYTQCGGIGWSGATCCVSGSLCTYSSDYYSQCIPSSTPVPTSPPTSPPQPQPTSPPQPQPTSPPQPQPTSPPTGYFKCLQCTAM